MNIADRLTEHATATPDGAAVIENDRITRFGALERAVWRAAASLRASGVGPGEVVAVAMADGVLRLVAGFALARIGAVQLQLARTDGLPLAGSLAARHRVAALVADHQVPGLPHIRRLRADPAWLEEDGRAPDSSLRAPGGDMPWMVLRTSGTTSAPKTILQSHATYAARRALTRGRYGFEREDRYLAVIPLDFQLGYAMCLGALWEGATVILATHLQRRSDLFGTADRHGATYTYITPTQLGKILSRLPANRLHLPGLRVLRCGSMAMSEAVRRAVVTRLSPNLVLSYGTSDLDCGITEADTETQARHPGSVGTLRPGVELEIVGDDGGVLRAGGIGQVRVRVPDMPAGYFDDAAATDKGFRGGWFYPGDLGMLTADGALYLKGRSDDMMNFAGIKIFPSDIESALLEHPAVVEAAAFPLESESHQHIPVAAVALRKAVAADDLLRWCAERLGDRAPQAIARMRRLPRGGSGKVLTREIARRMEAKIAASRTDKKRSGE